MAKRSSLNKPMSSVAFRAWRKRLALTQSEAAELLGLKSRMIQHYETGSHEVPRATRLACWALEMGILDFDGVQTLGGEEPVVIQLMMVQGDTRKLEKKRRKLAERMLTISEEAASP